MKYDLSKKPTRGAKRTLEAFSNGLLYLVAQKNFNSINVKEICELIDYPRATFYNYFEDKYDLLNYVLYTLGKSIKPEKEVGVSIEELLDEYFDRIYSRIFNNNEFVQQTIRHNNSNDTLIQSFITYLQKLLVDVFYSHLNNSNRKNGLNLPLELVAKQYANTLLLVLDWSLLQGRQVRKEQAKKYLKLLLVNM